MSLYYDSSGGSRWTLAQARAFCFSHFDSAWDCVQVFSFLKESEEWYSDLNVEMLCDVHTKDIVLKNWRAGYAESSRKEDSKSDSVSPFINLEGFMLLHCESLWSDYDLELFLSYEGKDFGLNVGHLQALIDMGESLRRRGLWSSRDSSC